MGATLSTLGVALKNAASFQNTTNLYQIKIPAGTHLAELKSGMGNIGTVLNNETNKIAGQAVINPVNPIRPVSFDPTMVFMAASLANMDRKLDTVLILEKEMLDYLALKDEAEMRGSLVFLQDTMKSYRYNWNDNVFRQNALSKAMDIRNKAEEKIILYREKICKVFENMNTNKTFHNDADVKKDMHKVSSLFNDYRLALFLCGYSTYIETLLQGNYNADNLNVIAERLENRNSDYQSLYTEVAEKIKQKSDSSVESAFLKSIRNITKETGKTIARIPIVNKGPIDEALIGAGDTLDRTQQKKLQNSMNLLKNTRVTGIRQFIENINMLGQLYNRPIDMMFDKDNMYIKYLAA